MMKETDVLMELTIDLEAISAQMLMMYEGLESGGFSVVPEQQAKAVDGCRRYLNRVINELEEIDSNYRLTRITKATA